MKNQIFFSIIFCLYLSPVFSQSELYGVTMQGGTDDIGVFYRNNLQGDEHTLLHSFNICHGQNPQMTTLCKADNAKLYGLTYLGGNDDLGVIFEYDPVFSTYQTIHHFSPADDGALPTGSLLQASNGKLYGLSTVGGVNGIGTIFSYDPTTEAYAIHFHFINNIGSSPFGSLIEAANGKLYGMTRYGGVNGVGVIFEFNPASNTVLKIHDFVATEGYSPLGTLFQADDGFMYGLTFSGGSSGMGTIFRFDIETTDYTTLHEFSGTDGRGPYTSVIQAQNGNLYGTTPFGGNNDYGVVFEYNIQTNTFTVIMEMELISGIYPVGQMFETDNDILIGSWREGGKYSRGGIYSINLNNYQAEVIGTFSNNEGANPMGGFCMHDNGMLYGLTNAGGSPDVGTCFSLDPDTWEKQTVFEFDNLSFGALPTGNLVQYEGDYIYGTTYLGGIYEMGTIYAFNMSTGQMEKKYDFNGTLGSYPLAGLTIVEDIIFGVTNSGGSNAKGVIYKYIPSTNSFEIMFNFSAGFGYGIYNPPLYDGNNKLYGTTLSGGINDDGIIYEYNLGTNTYQILHEFEQSTGINPVRSLVFTDENTLMGHTAEGGDFNHGVIYKLDITTGTYTKVFDFDGTNGSLPFGNMAVGDNNKLYGTTDEGGTNNKGVLFQFDPNTLSYTKLHDFNTPDGETHVNGLIYGSNGLIYGMAAQGGACGCGVYYSYSAGTNVFEILHEFDFGLGNMPQHTILLEVCNLPDIVTHPQDAEAEAGDNVYFSVSADGDVQGYLWYHNNVEIASSNTAILFLESVTDADAGQYFCEIIGSCGSVYSNSATLTLTDNINQLNLSTFKCFPNPFNEQISVSFINEPCEGEIEILNIQGIAIRKQPLSGEQQIDIQLGELDPGIYLLKIFSENTCLVKKIIKQ